MLERRTADVPVQTTRHHPGTTRPAIAAKRRNTLLQVLLLLVLFVVAGLFYFSEADGDDLSSSYLGCRLIATGQSSHLYAHDPKNFAAIGPDDPWQLAADQAHYEAFLHPYVQTPLWAYALQPLCTRTDFPAFKQIFAAVAMLSFAGCIALIAWFWTPGLLRPLPIALLLLVLWFSQPFQYAMLLMQTHVLFLLLTLASLVLAEKKRPGLAGLLLACAAAVKITPAILIVYWLVRKQWRPVLSTVAWSALLWILTVVATGHQLVTAYLANFHRVSGILLLNQNNQSFAAWYMGHFYPAIEATRFIPLPLPHILSLTSTALTALCAMAGGLLDRRSDDQTIQPPAPQTHFETHRQTFRQADHQPPNRLSQQEQSLPGYQTPNPLEQSTFAPQIQKAHDRAPIGALLTLVAATAFAPIAWTHYSIVLIAPVMVLIQAYLDLRWRWLTAAAALITALNLRPLATDVVNINIGPLSLLRSHFYAELLCIAALGTLAQLHQRAGPRHFGDPSLNATNARTSE